VAKAAKRPPSAGLKQFPLPAGRYSGLADVVAVGVGPVIEEVFFLPDEGEEGGLFVVASKRPAMSNDAGGREVVEPSNCAKCRRPCRWQGRGLRRN